MKALKALAAMFAFIVAAPAQTVTNPPPFQLKVLAGEKVEDTNGVVVENGGGNGNGHLIITCTGKVKRRGNVVIVDKITRVDNPASQGSEGPISVDTGGNAVTVNLARNNNAGPGAQRLTANITGGNANVKVDGDGQNVNLDGRGNDVQVTGNNNSLTTQPGSTGTMELGGRGNQVIGGGAGWTIRN